MPSFCNSIYGLGTTIWAVHPFNPAVLENLGNFADACYVACESVADYCKTVDQNILNECIEQVKILSASFDQISDVEKGTLIGHAVGKYGVEIITGSLTCAIAPVALAKGGKTVLKANEAFKNLRNANRACTLETMAMSQVNKEKVIAIELAEGASKVC